MRYPPIEPSLLRSKASSCIVKIAKALKVDRMVSVRVRNIGDDYHLVLKMIVGESGDNLNTVDVQWEESSLRLLDRQVRKAVKELSGGILEVATVNNADIYVDGKHLEDGRKRIKGLSEGRHRLKVVVPGDEYEVFEQDVTVSHGERKIIKVDLVRNIDFKISSTPIGAKIYLTDKSRDKKNEKIGETNFKGLIGNSNRTITVTLKKEGYADTTLTINLNRDTFREIDKKVKLDLSVKAKKKKRRIKATFLISTGTLAVGGLVTALVFQGKAKDELAEHDKPVGKSPMELQTHWDAYQGHLVKRNVFYGVARAALAGFSVTLFF